MGYFNYFIKCIIRNIAYKLCKPKVFITVLLSIIILFGLKHYGFCAWTDGEIEACLDGLATITSNQGVMISQLSSMGVDVKDLENSLSQIKSALSAIQGNQATIATQIYDLTIKVDTLNTNILNIYNTLEENQQELISTIVTNNQEVLEELRFIREALNGSDVEIVPHTESFIISNTSVVDERLKCITFDYVPNYNYNIKIYFDNPFGGNMDILVYSSDNLIPSNYNYNDYKELFLPLGTVPPNSSSFILEYTVPTSHPKYIYITWGGYVTNIVVEKSISGLSSSIDKNNDLQQQGNQLQQEQNDFLKQESSDTDVSVDGFNSVDSNDITSEGLTGVFTNIYSSITSWNSKDINLPIPYTNKNIIIPATYTENMLRSSGGSWIITFISSIYYFIVARFIIYSITSIINSIKSGSILETDSKNNITTDML